MDKMRHQSQVILICIKIVLNATRPYFLQKKHNGVDALSAQCLIFATQTIHARQLGQQRDKQLPVQRFRDEFALCCLYVFFSFTPSLFHSTRPSSEYKRLITFEWNCDFLDTRGSDSQFCFFYVNSFLGPRTRSILKCFYDVPVLMHCVAQNMNENEISFGFSIWSFRIFVYWPYSHKINCGNVVKDRQYFK